MPSVNQYLASALSFIIFFSHCCSDVWSRESCLFGLSRGAILAFKLSFDAALERVTASGSSLIVT